jgi:hypothetical protein
MKVVIGIILAGFSYFLGHLAADQANENGPMPIEFYIGMLFVVAFFGTIILRAILAKEIEERRQIAAYRCWYNSLSALERQNVDANARLEYAGQVVKSVVGIAAAVGLGFLLPRPGAAAGLGVRSINNLDRAKVAYRKHKDATK